MATTGTVRRWASTRKAMREGLGLGKRSTQTIMDPSTRASDKGSFLRSLFDDYDALSTEPASERKLAKVRERLLAGGFTTFKDSDINYALHSPYAQGDAELAFEMLDIIENADAGKLEPYSADVRLAGANNNSGVTCYLDSTLFAMFARLDDFEAMLYHTFDDAPRRRLVVLLRLWVNMIRSGKLVTINFMAELQSALAGCGWEDAARKQQQDASEAFNFITDVLDLPRLTLKKDMFHQGKADNDDHKYTNERTIDVGIPELKDGKTVTLEDCLLEYFDERVVVERERDGAIRRNTLGSSHDPFSKKLEAESEKPPKALHIEVIEVPSSNPGTPTGKIPVLEGRPPFASQGRQPSTFQDKPIQSPSRQNSLPVSASRNRSNTTGKAVKMPAFQFFRLIPWYTETNPNTDLQVAQHFETKRPTVGICLKRFGQKKDGAFYKRKDKVDIPLETGIPEFLHDDDFSDEKFPNHKFKLSLQSIICHRGEAIQRGHYVSFVRADRPQHGVPMDDPQSCLRQNGDPWLRFDDLATPKIQYVDIKRELELECPYLLFYKIVLRQDSDRPGRVSMDGRPPSYSELAHGRDSLRTTASTPTLHEPPTLGALGLSSSTESHTSQSGKAVAEGEAQADADKPGNRPISAPANLVQEEVEERISRDRNIRSPRTSTSGAAGSGSIGRSFGTIFKSSSGSNRRLGDVIRKTSPDVRRSKSHSIDATGAKMRLSVDDEADIGNTTQKLRKSMDASLLVADERKGILKKEGRHGRRGGTPGDKADRECVLM